METITRAKQNERNVRTKLRKHSPTTRGLCARQQANRLKAIW